MTTIWRSHGQKHNKKTPDSTRPQLNSAIQNQLKNKLKERLENPHVPASRLHCFENHYKIKLRTSGYRLVYEIIDSEVIVMVVAVGKRDKNLVYQKTSRRNKG